MSVDECHDTARYAVLTRLGDSWIFRAALGDRESAEAEAFRWRRIYGPGRTLIASLGQFSDMRDTASSPAASPLVIDVEAEAVAPPPAANDDIRPPALLAARLPSPLSVQAFSQSGAVAQMPNRRRQSRGNLGWGETLLRALALYLGYLLANRLIDLTLQVQIGGGSV